MLAREAVVTVRSSMPVSPSFRDRLDALPLDRAPLRRAGLLTVLLVVLLVLGKVFGPGQATSASTIASRHDVQGATEEVSASPRSTGWTGGRMLAVLLLAAGGGAALVLHRRRPSAASKAEATLDVIETHPLGPGQSLRLVACGAEVLLLSVGGDGARLLRHWPRDAFDRGGVSFADALAEATESLAPDLELDVEPPALPVAPEPAPLAVPVAESGAAPAVAPATRGALFPAPGRSAAGPLRQFRAADV